MIHKKNIIVLLLLFLLIFTPPLLTFNILHVLGAISYIYLLINFQSSKRLFTNKKIQKLLFILILLLTYISIVSLSNSNGLLAGISFMYWIFEIIPISAMISIYFLKHSVLFDDLIDYLMLVGTIQGILALLSFIFPDIQTFFIDRLIQYGYENTFQSISSVRMFGFASNLTYTTPLFLSILAIIAFYLSLTRSIKYIFFIPLLVFSAIINARTSFVLLVFGVLLVLILNIARSNRYFIKTIFTIVIISIFVLLINSFLSQNGNNTFIWITQGLNEIYMFFQGNTQSGYFSYLLNPNWYILPSDVNIFFGYGVRILTANPYNVRSDIGFVNDIWLGGVFYISILYVSVYKLISSISKNQFIEKRFRIFLQIFIIGVLIISNIKGYVIGENEITTFILLICIYGFSSNEFRKYTIKN